MDPIETLAKIINEGIVVMNPENPRPWDSLSGGEKHVLRMMAAHIRQEWQRVIQCFPPERI